MLKVLIVDDEYIMRQGLKYMIDWEGEGYRIAGEATNGDEALKMLPDMDVDIIICDVVMPVMDGVDFTDVVHSMYPKTQIIILSGYDNFEYVKHTLMNGVVDYILKPTLNPEELRKVLNKAAERIPDYRRGESAASSNEKKLEKYLTGEEDLDTGEFEKAYNYGYYRFYALNIKQNFTSGADVSDALHKRLMRSLKDLQVIRYVCTVLRDETAVVLFNYEMHDGPSLKEIIKGINEDLCHINPNVFGVVSESFTEISKLKEVYESDVATNTERGFYYPGVNLMYAKDLAADREASDVRFDFFKFNQLLLSTQFGEALDMLDRYDDVALDAKTDTYGLKNQIKNMLYHCLNCMDLTDTQRDNLRHRYFLNIDEAAYRSEYKAAVKEAIAELKECSGVASQTSDERIEKMLQYISDNYREDLKLEDLANEFNFNYHYLSTYFAQQMNEGFSDYLNRLRINKACELLSSKDIPISEVGMEVGYSDHSYFSRVFKKLTGRTPSEWRREGDRE